MKPQIKQLLQVIKQSHVRKALEDYFGKDAELNQDLVTFTDNQIAYEVHHNIDAVNKIEKTIQDSIFHIKIARQVYILLEAQLGLFAGIRPIKNPAVTVPIFRYKTDENEKISLHCGFNAVKSGKRSIKNTVWTLEADMLRGTTLHGMDMECEMITAVADGIATEVVLQSLSNLNKNAKTKMNHSIPVVPLRTDIEDLVITINRASSAIAMATRRGKGNTLIVTDPMIYQLLKVYNDKFLSTYKLHFLHDYSDESKIYVCYKNHSENPNLKNADVGYGIYPYYIGRYNVINPNDFSPVTKFDVHSATFQDEMSSSYYGVITIDKQSKE